MLKTISKIALLKEQNQGFRAINLSEQLESIDPFIILTNFWMPRAFFPPHPHAGFSVMTYMFPDSEGSFINRDSLGDKSKIEPGAIHLTQAGKGVLHEEIPEVEGRICHGLQMWLNHSSNDRFVEPRAMHVKNKAVPEVNETNCKIRVLLGSYNGTDASIKPLPEVTLLDVYLKPNSTFTHQVNENHISFIMMVSGQALVNGANADKLSAIKFSDDGNTIEIRAKENNTSFLVATGKPFNEQTLFGGPFVMSTPEQLHEAKLSFGKGEMGKLSASSIFKYK
jgi:quercetin 2,3-dioxygenase